MAAVRLEAYSAAPAATHGHDAPRGRQASRSRRIRGPKGLAHIGGTIIKLAWEDLKNARFSFITAAGTTILNPFQNWTQDSPIYCKSQNGAEFVRTKFFTRSALAFTCL